MSRLIAGIILIALCCAGILGQQKDKPGSMLPTSTPAALPAPDQPQDVTSFQLPAPRFPFGQSQIKNLLVSPSAQSNEQEGPFVFQGGALYMRVPGGQFLVPVSGGGASGCFNLDLAQRIRNLNEFKPKLDSLEVTRPAPH